MERAVLQTAANQFVASYGDAAGPMLRARADLAAERGNMIAASTWREMADATAMIGAGGPIADRADCRESEAHVLAIAIRRFTSEFRPSLQRMARVR